LEGSTPGDLEVAVINMKKLKQGPSRKSVWLRRTRLACFSLLVFFVILIGIVLGIASYFGTWFAWIARSSDGNLSLVFLESPNDEVVAVPSEAKVYVMIVEARSPNLSISQFPIGWREVLEDAQLLKRGDIPGDLIMLTMKSTRSEPGMLTSGKEYYSICAGSLSLVRLEANDGTFAPNAYFAPNLTVGPELPKRTAEEWESGAWSNNVTEVLRTLVWLGGHHAEPSSCPASNLYHEDFGQARLVREVHCRPRVRSRIAELRESTNEWIREAASRARLQYTRIRTPE
jgi:hypothetical protein